MAEVLYALKRDLDMVTDDVQNLKRSYNLLDYIAKVVRDCQLEQMAQAAQMRRIEERMGRIEERMGRIEERMDRIEERMEKIEKTLLLIVRHLERIDNHLGIEPPKE